MQFWSNKVISGVIWFYFEPVSESATPPIHMRESLPQTAFFRGGSPLTIVAFASVGGEVAFFG